MNIKFYGWASLGRLGLCSWARLLAVCQLGANVELAKNAISDEDKSIAP